MVSTAAGHVAEVTVRRYTDSSECDVVVVVREQKMVIKCRDECKAFKVPDAFAVERVD